MNQLPVRLNGAAGRDFAMLAGARALNCTPGSVIGAALSVAGALPGAAAGAVASHADADTPAVTIAKAIRLKLDLMIGICLPGCSTSRSGCRDARGVRSARG